ncbi:hypothetical protein [Methylobacterium sp. Leaf112]|uniref:hypothetical protein n=1 Tax=Methylobacterium sp. Leaf112 TaxID=1736258 RepID=UPI000ACEFCEC|nr:hypothetical protein [Methylobacterium sp. Leaf112]
MSKLERADRETLPEKKIALPDERKYPLEDRYLIEDKTHARNVKACAAQQEKCGNLSVAGHRRVYARGDAVLGQGVARRVAGSRLAFRWSSQSQQWGRFKPSCRANSPYPMARS